MPKLGREFESVSVCPRDKVDVYRQEESLRHVAMVATFLDDNKPKRHCSHCFKLHRAYLISFNLSNVGEIFWVKSERTLSKVWKKNTFLCLVHRFHKSGA